jgi:hypothetical protein
MADPERIPDGYRQAITTAITVSLGFSLTFLRTFWAREAPSGWSPTEIIDESFIGIGLIIQVITLFRALGISDNEPRRYRHTARLFLTGVVVVAVGVVSSIFTK